MGFKMKPPYKTEPTPVYEVPFDNPDLVAKANKNGTIIVNKDRVQDKKLMDEAMSHEKQHLKDMQDGTLDYDNLSVTFKGKRYGRDSFDEGNENLPWEKRAYAAGRNRKKIDLTPKKKKLTGPPAMSDGKPLLVDNTSSPFQALDENEVNMNESFGPSLELDEIAEQLDKAVIAHGLQSKGIKKHIKEMEGMNKGTALQSPIKMWGAPAFEEGKDTDASGTTEEEKQQDKVNKQAEENVVFDPSTRTEVESDRPGYKKFRTTGTGSAEGYTVGTEKMSNEDWKKWLQTEEGKKYTASKNKEKFDYEKQPDTPKEKPKKDYSYLDGATFGSGYQAGDFTTYGLQVMSKVGDDDPRAQSQQREGEDPMSRYLRQDELDYLTSTGRLKGKYSSGYDAYYKGKNKEGKMFQDAVKKGIITADGITVPLNPMKAELESSKNLLAETGLKD
jgi:hypothetical protein